MADGNVAQPEGGSEAPSSIEITIEDPEIVGRPKAPHDDQSLPEITPQSVNRGVPPGGSGSNSETAEAYTKILKEIDEKVTRIVEAAARGDHAGVRLIIKEHELARLRRLILIEKQRNFYHLHEEQRRARLRDPLMFRRTRSMPSILDRAVKFQRTQSLPSILDGALGEAYVKYGSRTASRHLHRHGEYRDYRSKITRQLPPQIPQLLHYAAEKGNTDLLKIVLIDQGPDVNAQDRGLTALTLACWKGHAEIVEELLRRGADVHIYTRDGFTCLHLAAFCGHIAVVNILLHGKSQRKYGDKCDSESSWTKNCWALIRKETGIENFTALHMAAGGSENQDKVNSASSVAAVWKLRTEGLRNEIKQDVDEFLQEVYPWFKRGSRDEDNVEIVSSILEALVASVLEFYEAATAYECLHLAEDPKEENKKLFCEFLLQVRKAIYLMDGEIFEEGLLKDLAAYGDSDGYALKEKLGNEYEGLARAFVELVSFSNAKDKIGRTVLHHAACGNGYKLVRFLIRGSQFGAVANVNGADVQGHTALHLASVIGHETVVKELMSFHLEACTERKGHKKEFCNLEAEIMSVNDQIQSTAQLYSLINRTKHLLEPIYKMELDDLFDGTSYLQPNLVTSPSGGSVFSLIRTINQEAEALAENLEDNDYRNVRSLLFSELVKNFVHYKIGGTPYAGQYEGKTRTKAENLEESNDRRKRPLPDGWSFLSKEQKKVFYYYRIGESPFVIQAKGLKWTGERIWFENRAGYTPLHYAVERDLEDIVALLVMHPQTDLFRCASDGRSPWTMAQRQLYARYSLTGYPGQIWIEELATSKGFWVGEFQISVEHYFNWMKFHQKKLFKRAVKLARAAESSADPKDPLQILEAGIIETFKSYLDLDQRYWYLAPDRGSPRFLYSYVTLLHAAAYYGLGDEIEALLKLKRYRAVVNDREDFTIECQTALHFAADGGVDAMAELLEEKTLALTQQSSWLNLTPLAFIEKKIQWLKTSHEFNSPRTKSSIWYILNPSLDHSKKPYEQQLKMLQKCKLMLMENPRLVEMLYRDRQVFVDAANAILVGAALIASVTFGGFLQPPLGYVPFNVGQSSSSPKNFAAVEQHITLQRMGPHIPRGICCPANIYHQTWY